MPEYANTGLTKVEIERVEHPTGMFGFAITQHVLRLCFSDKPEIEYVIATKKEWTRRRTTFRVLVKQYHPDSPWLDSIKRL